MSVSSTCSSFRAKVNAPRSNLDGMAGHLAVREEAGAESVQGLGRRRIERGVVAIGEQLRLSD